MIKGKRKSRLLTSKEILFAYNLLYKEGLISFPLTNKGENNIDSIIGNINNTYFGYDNYPSLEEKAVALLYFIIKDHPFTDGNKRMAVLSFKIFCRVNNIIPNKKYVLDELAIFIEGLEEEHDDAIPIITKMLFNDLRTLLD